MKRSIFIWLGILEAFIAVGAIPAGLLLIMHPDGSSVGLNVDLLKNSQFHNYLIPGLFLFFVNGMCQAFAAILAFKKHKSVAPVTLFLGMMLLIWVCVQVYSIGYLSFMQPMFFIIALLELSMGMIILKGAKSESK